MKSLCQQANFQMLTTHSVKNEERAVQLECYSHSL